MKHLVHTLGLLMVAFSLAFMPLPSAAVKAGVPCCDEMKVAMAGMHHAAQPSPAHHPCSDSNPSGEQPDCCKQMAHAPAAVLLNDVSGTTPVRVAALVALLVAVPESAPSGIRTPPPNA